MGSSGLNDLMRTRSAEAFKPVAYDLWNLYRTIRRMRPKVVLEIGVGCSSLVFAEAVARNRIGHVYSVDANERWLGETESNLSAQRRQWINFVHSPVEMLRHGGEVVSRYTALPDVVPDLMYLDAPHPSDIPGWPSDLKDCAIDPLILEPKLSPGFRLLVDGRNRNVAFLRRHLKRDYKFRQHDMFGVATFTLVN